MWQCNKSNLRCVEIFSGGFPCVDLFVAGNMEGIGTPDDPTDRSGLWFQFLRIIGEFRPFWVPVENVDRLLRTRDGDTVLDGLDRAQYDCWPLVMTAEDLGTPHQRKRTFILARDRNAVELPPVAESRHNVIGALDAARAEWLRIKQELGQVRQPPADPEAAYAKIVEQLRDHPEWTARYGCCGNSVVCPIAALIGASLPSLAPKTAKQVGPLLRESLAGYCKNFCGKVFAEWTERRTPGGRAYHVMKTKERSMPLAIGPDGKPLTKVVDTPSAQMPLVKKWTVGNPVTK